MSQPELQDSMALVGDPRWLSWGDPGWLTPGDR